MDTTVLLSKILGPVLLLRGISIFFDRQQVVTMLERLEEESTSAAFSALPVILFMASLALAVTHKDTSNPAAVILHIIAWFGILKGAALILRPKAVLAFGRHAGQTTVLHCVWVVSVGLGAYLTWFGYIRAT